MGMILRALKLISERPSRLLKIFTHDVWRQLVGLRLEGMESPEAAARAEERRLANSAAFRGEQWRHEGELSRRVYGSFEEYRRHQAGKLTQLGGEAWIYPERTISMFKRRFDGVPAFRNGARVLCLAARRGEEVKALLEMGCDAIGIDLNPGENNPLVMTGDFHNLQFAAGEFDSIYTNSLDHVFDLSAVMAEARRVLKPGGAFVADIVVGYSEGYSVGPHDAMHWPTARGFAEHLADLSDLKLASFRDLQSVGSKDWTQAVLVTSTD